jgi:uncharacterized protein (DUF58 family)
VTVQEFHYRLPGRVGGQRPGSHPGTSLGAGQEFVSHTSLYNKPDPRRLDLRASLRNVQHDWLVRVYRQRASVPVHAVVDVSASMAFGAERTKLDVAADFVEALGNSAFRVGDAVGLLAFDAVEREDLYVPASMGRGMGHQMASSLRGAASAGAGGIEGLEQAVLRLAGREGLVFIVSDFHWPLDRLGDVLDLLAHALVVPVVSWDAAETQPPGSEQGVASVALASLRDVESGRHRMLWMRPSLRERWREGVAMRRQALDDLFEAKSVRPFYLSGSFDGDAMSDYFFEATA